VRIIAGAWRGRPLQAPAGQATRPTSDRAREALFSMLASRLGSFTGLHVIDLFAGTGALGLEALSRGAASCSFVEQDRAALAALTANIAKLGATAARVIAGDATRMVAGGPYDLALLDPPYRTGLADQALTTLNLAEAGWASVETALDERLALAGYTVEVERVYGKAKLWLLRKNGG
jgi:16S rRNA (guanine966-N2)-methyltransferase